MSTRERRPAEGADGTHDRSVRHSSTTLAAAESAPPSSASRWSTASAGLLAQRRPVERTAGYGVGVPKFSFQLDVRDPPAKVIGAMVDFSERRPEIWPNLTARLYRVHELGPRTADVTEGTALAGADIWERVTYEWTDSVVRGVITDGRIFEPGGTFEFRVEPHGAGSRISNDYHRRSKTVLGRCLGAMLQISGGAPIKRSFRQVYGKPG